MRDEVVICQHSLVTSNDRSYTKEALESQVGKVVPCTKGMQPELDLEDVVGSAEITRVEGNNLYSKLSISDDKMESLIESGTHVALTAGRAYEVSEDRVVSNFNITHLGIVPIEESSLPIHQKG